MFPRSTAVLWFFLMLAAQPLCWAQGGQAEGGAGVFFSQGQAVYDPQDLAKSQQAAIHDLMVQGATQALGSFLSPEQMGHKYATLQDHVLKDPQRYVQSYQLFSEQPVDGLYRVVGEVTIDMQTLRSDLRKLGFQMNEAPPAEPAAGTEQPAAAEEPTPPAATGQAAAPGQEPEQGNAGATKILWAVAEKGDSGWILAHSGNDRETVFATSVLQESQDYDWALVFPATGALTPDTQGEVGPHAAIALARQLGVPVVVTGIVTLGENPTQGPVLKTHLQIFDVATGQTLGEIHKELLLQDAAFQEAAINLAAAVMPQLDSMVRHHPQPAAGPQVAPANGDAWTLIIQGDRRQACWGQLEQLLREHYHALRVQSMELGPHEAKIHLAGLDPNFYQVLQELQLSNGAQMQVDRYSPQLHAVQVTVRVGSE